MSSQRKNFSRNNYSIEGDCYGYFIYTKSILTRSGVHSCLEKHRIHQAEVPCSPYLRKGDQTFVVVRVSIKERSWLRLIKHAGSKRNTFSCKRYFFSNSNTIVRFF